ncbi:hypothetical protein C8R43DRAFT_489091 [Mycena crocata]|nr:hypothetical protein C8R43DRAFT_489091 [Mycena crocata]
MSKRKRVSSALEFELSEYSSLLRALHTSDTLDLAKHITLAPPPPKKKRKSAPVPDVEEQGSSSAAPKAKRPRKRDTWTRWPLLVKDVHVPEWGLQDEIETLVRACLRNNRNLHPALDEEEDAQEEADVDGEEDGDVDEEEAADVDDVEDADVDDEEDADVDDEEDDAPSFLPHVTQSASNFLSSILALLAHHTPPRVQSLQNRLNPLDWQNVVNILAACDLPTVDATMINTVKTRMEAIYGPFESDAVERAELHRSKRASTALDEADDAMLTFHHSPKRQPMRREPVVPDDIDSDDLDS